MLKYHLDENAERAIADGLRLRGLDVTTTPPDVPTATSDSDQLAWCLAEERVIVSHDRDMLRYAAAGVEHAGVVFYRSRHRTFGELIARLVTLSRLRTPETMRGCVEYL